MRYIIIDIEASGFMIRDFKNQVIRKRYRDEFWLDYTNSIYTFKIRDFYMIYLDENLNEIDSSSDIEQLLEILKDDEHLEEYRFITYNMMYDFTIILNLLYKQHNLTINTNRIKCSDVFYQSKYLNTVNGCYLTLSKLMDVLNIKYNKFNLHSAQYDCKCLKYVYRRMKKLGRYDNTYRLKYFT